MIRFWGATLLASGHDNFRVDMIGHLLFCTLTSGLRQPNKHKSTAWCLGIWVQALTTCQLGSGVKEMVPAPRLLQLDLEILETAAPSMLLLRVYCAAALFSVAFAAIDLLQILQDTPPCATNCTLSILPAAGCPITEMDSCLCGNNDLQKAVAVCVLQRCSLQEQYSK